MNGTWKAIPVHSLARKAGKADVEMLKPLLNFAWRRLGNLWPLHLVVGDKGYISAKRGRFLRRNRGVGLVVAPKADMTPPEGTNSTGCPICPFGEELVWDDYDPADDRLLYRGATETCEQCPLAGGCPKRFDFAASDHETFWGMVPYHSRLCRELLRLFRPRSEPSFNIAKNHFRLKEFFINSLDLAKTLCVMSDVTETLKIMAQEGPCEALQSKKQTLRDIIQPELWD